AGYQCGGCLDDISALCGTRTRFSYALAWIAVAALLSFTVSLFFLPAWPLPQSVLSGDFIAHQSMTDPISRQISGYTFAAVILATLLIRGSRYRYRLHVCLGV